MFILSIIILILVVIVLLLSYALYFIIKKATYISDKEKDFILFTIDMYIEHFGDMKLISKEKHDKLVEELKKIKGKYFK